MSRQLSIINFLEQKRQLERVTSRIGLSVYGFCRERGCGSSFHMTELTDWARRMTGTAPDSPGRILRALRQNGHIEYEVVDRAKSLYRLTRVAS
jgi:hypothetical protein